MPEADDLMDEDGAAADLSPRAANPRLRCTIARENDDSAHRKTKGRGFREEKDSDRQRCLSLRDFESLGSDGGPGPQRSIEGWINLVTAVYEEAQEDDISNAFGDFGQIKSLHVNLDRLTGFVKEYAYLEYEKSKEAQNAIKAMNGAELLTQNVNVDWAFCNGPSAGSYRKKNMRFLCVNLGFSPATTTQGCILSDFEKIADFLRKAAHITSVLHRKYGKPHKDLCGSL